jgi:hypothetical protein
LPVIGPPVWVGYGLAGKAAFQNVESLGYDIFPGFRHVVKPLFNLGADSRIALVADFSVSKLYLNNALCAVDYNVFDPPDAHGRLLESRIFIYL